MNTSQNRSLARRSVVVTGLGAVTPLGTSVSETWNNLVSGISGIGPITHFDTTDCPVTIAGEIKDFDPIQPIADPVYPRGKDSEPLLFAVDPKEQRKIGRFAQVGAVASLEAYVDSGIDASRSTLAAERMGVILGVGIGGLPEIESTHETWREKGYRRISPFFVLQIVPNMLAGHVSMKLDLRGPNFGIVSACATSGHSLGEAAATIARGDADFMLAGGAEAAVSPLAIGAFAQMKALSSRNENPTTASRPFDAARDGFVFGEGSVVFALEEKEHALARGAKIYAELSGYGATADAYHYSSLPPAAEGSQRSMRKAIEDAGLQASDIDYVSAHATSTPAGDIEEARAIASVFAENRDRLSVSAVKSMTGHLLGAAGAMGALAAVKAIETNTVPPTANLQNIDPAIAELRLRLTPNQSEQRAVRHCLGKQLRIRRHKLLADILELYSEILTSNRFANTVSKFIQRFAKSLQRHFSQALRLGKRRPVSHRAQGRFAAMPLLAHFAGLLRDNPCCKKAACTLFV